MKTFLLNVMPVSLINHYRNIKRNVMHRQNRKKKVETVFTEIYQNHVWGGTKGKFSSGSGTRNKRFLSEYISMITTLASREKFSSSIFVDLGCGDFIVGKHLLPLCSAYIGVDIVKPLIHGHQRKYGNTTTIFLHQDIVSDRLPIGDVCFIRQVFQHLSNRQIAAVLPKLKAFKWVFITEHYPEDNDSIQPNKDKPHGSDIRAYDNSGVYLTKPPFDLPSQSFVEVLAISADGLGKGYDQGVIRTFLYRPQNA